MDSEDEAFADSLLDLDSPESSPTPSPVKRDLPLPTEEPAPVPEGEKDAQRDQSVHADSPSTPTPVQVQPDSDGIPNGNASASAVAGPGPSTTRHAREARGVSEDAEVLGTAGPDLIVIDDAEESSSPLHAGPGATSVASSDPLNIRSEDGAWRESSAPILVRDSETPPASAQPRARRLPRERSRRGDPVVQIDLMPLYKLKRSYHHPDDLGPPTEHSRRELLRQQDHGESSSGPSRLTISRSASTTGRNAWRNGSLSLSVTDGVRSRDELDYSQAGDEADSEESDELFSEDSDIVPLRRSTRPTLKEVRPPSRMTRSHHQPEKKAKQTHKAIHTSAFYQQPARRGPGRPRKMTVAPSTRSNSESDASYDGGGRRKANWNRTASTSESDFDMDEGEDEIDSSSDLFEQEESDDWSEDAKAGKSKQPSLGPEVLREHRAFCEKCTRPPADDLLETAMTRKKKPGRKRKRQEDEMSDEELARSLEGWLECQYCTVAYHWGCLGHVQKKEVIDELRRQEGPGSRRKSVAIDETSTFTCIKCSASKDCFVCHQEDLKSPTAATTVNGSSKDSDIEVDEAKTTVQKKDSPKSLHFRCFRCKQGAHYQHLRNPFPAKEKHSLYEIAASYQRPTAPYAKDGWLCHQCREWVWNVDLIIAWRPLPANAKEPKRAEDELPPYKEALPREYLVKWVGRGFRHATWVPHAWLLSANAAKLRNFLEKGPSMDLITDETLAAHGDDMDAPTIARVMEEDDRVHGTQHERHSGRQTAAEEWQGTGPPPDVNGYTSIPTEWKTIDRVLDVMLAPPRAAKKSTAKKAAPRGRRILSESPSDSEDVSESPGARPDLPDGLQPPADQMLEIEDWERAQRRDLTPEDADEIAPLVTWCFVKWDDLQYDQSCWDTPPPTDSPLYPAFRKALRNYLAARLVDVPVLSAADCQKRELKAQRYSQPPKEQPSSIVGGTLMPFQMEGLQWLIYKHFKRESCILADDMGLGKTIQIASLLGYLGTSEHRIFPCLVIVPQSTITNWVREFEKWVPHMRVVPYYGEAASRKVISKYELYHKGMQGKAEGLKAHVVLTTYESITGPDFRVFSSVPRWEMLVVDEGQRLKSDSNLIFNRLKQLNSVHRILLTGTPLNNNLRELFNLLNFLDPEAFHALEDLEKRFENLNESLVQELHTMIAPYILRRIKADVLKLPPKVEIIVPISLSPLQKGVYKGILERNAEVIRELLQRKRREAALSGKKIPGLPAGAIVTPVN